MALYELSDEMLALATFPAVDGGSVSVGELLKSTRPLTPGQAIVSALFPQLDADVRDALGELIGTWLAASPHNEIGLGSDGFDIVDMGDRDIAFHAHASSDPSKHYFGEIGHSNVTSTDKNALIPAIKAATERLKG